MSKGFMFIILSMFTISLYAQKDTVKLSTIIVKYNSFFLTDSNKLKKLRLTTAEKLFQQTPFINVKEYGISGAATINLLGLSPSHTQILIDEIPINSPMTGQTDISNIPLSLISNVSINAGINSQKKIFGAPAGAITFNTFPKDTISYIGINLATLLSADFMIKTIKKTKKFTIFLKNYINISKNKFYYQNITLPDSPIVELKDAQKKIFTQQLGTIYKLKKTTFYLYTLLNYNKRQIPPLMTFSGIHRDEKLIGNWLLIHLSAQKKINKTSVKIISAFYNSKTLYTLGDSIWTNINTKNFIPKNNSTNKTKNIINRLFIKYLQTNIIVDYHKIFVFSYDSITLTGYQAQRDLFSATFLYNYKKKYWNTKLFINQLYTTKQKLTYPSIGIITKIKNINFTIGNNYHLPTMNDLYWQPGGNPQLKPEKNFYTDLSFFYNKKYTEQKKWNIKTLIFFTIVKDWIQWRPTAFYYWKAENIQKVISRGVLLHYDYNTKINKTNLQINFDYSYIKTQNYTDPKISINTYKKQLIYLPINSFYISLSLKKSKFNYILAASYVGKRHTTADNNENFALPSYYLIDFQYIYNFKKFNFIFNLHNILNEQYYSVIYRPMPRRYAELTIMYSF